MVLRLITLSHVGSVCPVLSIGVVFRRRNPYPIEMGIPAFIKWHLFLMVTVCMGESVAVGRHWAGNK